MKTGIYLLFQGTLRSEIDNLVPEYGTYTVYLSYMYYVSELHPFISPI